MRLSRPPVLCRSSPHQFFSCSAFAKIADFLDFFVGQMLHPDEGIMCFAHPNEFVKLYLDSRGIPVLRVLKSKIPSEM